MENILMKEISLIEDPYKVREKILTFYGNNFIRYPFTYYKTISKPQILFDHKSFFEDSSLISYRFIDDFIDEILFLKKSSFPLCIKKYKYKLNVESFKSSCYGIVEIEKLIKEIYKHSYSYHSKNNIVFSRKLIIELLSRNEKTIAVNSIDFNYEEEDEEDEVIDIYNIFPENNLISTLNNILNCKQYCTKLFEQKCSFLLTENQENKYINSSLFLNILKNERSLFILRSQFFNDEHINLYYLENKLENNNLEIEVKIITKIIDDLLEKKLIVFNTMENYLTFFFSKYEEIIKTSTSLECEFFISFCSSCLVNCSLQSKILKRETANYERSLNCFSNLMNYLKTREVTRFDLDVILLSICCVFYNANFLSTLHFSEYYIKYENNNFLSEEITYCYSDYVIDQINSFLGEEPYENLKYIEKIDHSRFFSGMNIQELDNIQISENIKSLINEISEYTNSGTIIKEKYQNGINILDSYDISQYQLNIFKENFNKLDIKSLEEIRYKIEQCRKIDEQTLFVKFNNNYSEVFDLIPSNFKVDKLISLNNFYSIISEKEILSVNELINKIQEYSIPNFINAKCLNTFFCLNSYKLRIKDCSIFNDLIKNLMLFSSEEMMKNYIDDFLKKNF